MHPIVTKPSTETPPSERKPGFGFWFLLLFAIGAILLIVAQWEDVDFLDQDEDGNPILSEERQQKLNKALQELEEAEQYALVVERPGYYPCFSCTDSNRIFLNKGETWKYGMTTKKNRGAMDYHCKVLA